MKMPLWLQLLRSTLKITFREADSTLDLGLGGGIILTASAMSSMEPALSLKSSESRMAALRAESTYVLIAFNWSTYRFFSNGVLAFSTGEMVLLLGNCHLHPPAEILLMSCLQVHLEQHHIATADSGLSEYSYVCIQHASVIATVTLSAASIPSNSC